MLLENDRNAKIRLAFYTVSTPREFTSRGEQSVSQSHNYQPKGGLVQTVDAPVILPSYASGRHCHEDVI